ncbi:MAG: hypothetical protein COA32_00540 [Fluviicola sp.]|nr:MAG: hypothetical protein COA32_00540 [Fluviicola sp.]
MSNLSNEKLEIQKSVLIENYCNQIDEKINSLKLEYMREWEKNHSFNSSVIDKKLKGYVEEKEFLCGLLNNIEQDNIALDLRQLTITE